VAPELFDVLNQYAKDIEQGKVKPTPALGATSPALTFCENFYAQFFQNRLSQPIQHFDLEAKKAAVRLRMDLKEKNGPITVIQLITWYEKLCDIYSSVLALGYGVSTKGVFLDFHNNYLLILLERASAWAQAENYAEIDLKAKSALDELKKALQLIPK
jgi:hypothetical protein